ncbi:MULTISPECIES: nitrile hydratase subunit beta [unclassified Ruegeria]|uniref:nitrile hydratase subunit beta n=1 Tax=unclassified Ruegeria TaxID=2625375 RepID=UPI0014893CDD|nr:MULTISPECIES: nitrile hydratase subunit beta [unclassified Ruegeria]NOD63719.1 nitrile hydratase subunit beta [Ruegeria sp. HKCCD6109]
MTRVHDMGGRFGDGPINPEAEGAQVFAEEWHARALAVTLAAGFLRQWNIDVSRHARERLSPKDYARFSYYEKWISGLADLLVEKGVLTLDDLRGGGEEGAHPLTEKMLKAEAVSAALAKGGPADRPSNVAVLYSVGQDVITSRPAANRLVDGGHTRLPIYASGAKGRILRLHGTHVLPDANAHGLGEAPEPLYAVAFPASELWINPEHPKDEVVLDLWQSYLVPA